MRKRPLAMVCLVMIGFLFLHTRLVTASPPAFLEWEGKSVTVFGEVYDKETYFKAGKEVTVVCLKLSRVICEGRTAEIQAGDYRAICYLKANQKMPEAGSTVKATGRMRGFEKATNPGQFDSESYYQILKISFQLYQTEIQQQSHSYHKAKEALYMLRCKFADTFDHMLPRKDASVMKTMLLGEKKAVDEGRKELYQKSGIAHILAISGLHISLIGMTLFTILRRVGLPIGVCTALPAVLMLLYGGMTGFPVSVIRAVGMFVIHMTGRACFRTYDMLTAVMVMALLILWEQPLYFYSSSFLLSFGCVLAIALLIPALTKNRLKGEKEPPAWFGRIAGGAVISIAMLPLQMWFFYQIPVYSVLINLLVIPLMSFLLPSGLLLLIFGENSVFMGKAVAGLITGILAVYDGVCSISVELPNALFITGRPSLGRVIGYFGILLVVVICQKKLSLKKKWLLVWGAVVLLMWPTPEQCSITFLDVGQGDCIHIQSKSGKHYLIDGGSSTVSDVGKYRILPYLKYRGVRELEAIFITHPDEDHCNGILELLLSAQEEGITVKRLCLPDVGMAAKTKAYAEIVQAAKEVEVPVIYFSEGMCLQDEELKLQCLHPYRGYVTDNTNAYSLVLLMQYREFEALLTGDVEEEGEAALIQALQELADGQAAAINTKEGIGMNVDVLKVAHHGSRYSSSEKFLELVRPKLAVISCGENNSYGHPHAETLERFEDIGSRIFYTMENGQITIKYEKEALNVESFKNEMGKE